MVEVLAAERQVKPLVPSLKSRFKNPDSKIPAERLRGQRRRKDQSWNDLVRHPRFSMRRKFGSVCNEFK